MSFFKSLKVSNQAFQMRTETDNYAIQAIQMDKKSTFYLNQIFLIQINQNSSSRSYFYLSSIRPRSRLNKLSKMQVCGVLTPMPSKVLKD